MTPEQLLLDFGINGGISGGAGYLGGRIARAAVDLMKLIAAAFVLMFVALDRLGLITIHVDRSVEFFSNLGSQLGNLGGFGAELGSLITGTIPFAGGAAVGAYAGYKKVLI